MLASSPLISELTAPMTGKQPGSIHLDTLVHTIKHADGHDAPSVILWCDE
jgi:hypothetical protein